jgi:hypothetical protein
VREALTIIAFGTGNKSLIRTVAAASESHAAPPPAGSQHNPSTGTHQGCQAGCASSSGASEMMQAVESHAVPVSFKPQQGQGGSHSSLPFTGENVLEIVLAGLVLTGVGLMLKGRAKHERPSGAQLASR